MIRVIQDKKKTIQEIREDEFIDDLAKQEKKWLEKQLEYQYLKKETDVRDNIRLCKGLHTQQAIYSKEE